MTSGMYIGGKSLPGSGDQVSLIDPATGLPGATFTQTFDQTGSFPYHCEPHPSMTGTVIVEE